MSISCTSSLPDVYSKRYRRATESLVYGCEEGELFKPYFNEKITSDEYGKILITFLEKKKGDLKYIRLFYMNLPKFKPFLGENAPILLLDFSSLRTRRSLLNAKDEFWFIHPSTNEHDCEIEELVLDLVMRKKTVRSLITPDDLQGSVLKLTHLLTVLAYLELPHLEKKCMKLLGKIFEKYPKTLCELFEIAKENFVVRDFCLGYMRNTDHFEINAAEYLAFLEHFSNQKVNPNLHDFSEALTRLILSLKVPMHQFCNHNKFLQSHREVALEAVKKDGMCLGEVGKFQNDEEIVLAAVKENGYVLQYTSMELRNNRTIVIAALKNNLGAFSLASKDLRDDLSIVQYVVQYNGLGLASASKRLRDNKDVVMAAVSNDGKALRYASKRLRDDDEIVAIAVRKRPSVLRFASERICRNLCPSLGYTINGFSYCDDFKDNKELLLAEVKRNGFALEHAVDDLKNDEEIVLAAVKQSGCALRYASEALKSNRIIVLEAVKNDPYAFRFVGINLRDDEEIVIWALQAGSMIKYASERLKRDPDMIIKALATDGEAISSIDQRLPDYYSYLLKAVQQNGRALYDFNLRTFRDDEKIMLAAVKNNGNVLLLASPRLKNDRNIVKAAIQNNGYAIDYASPELQTDRELAMLALLNTKHKLMDIFKDDTEFFLTSLMIR